MVDASGTGLMIDVLELQGGGEIHRVGIAGLLIGRAEQCDLRLDSRVISARHARVSLDAGAWWIEDLQSTNGTKVDGQGIRERTALHAGASIQIGNEVLRVLRIQRSSQRSATFGRAGEGFEQRVAAAASSVPVRGAPTLTDATIVHPITMSRGLWRIGRDTSNDVIIDDRNVSRFHAELEVGGSRSVLRDLGSCNGTRVNGESVQQAEVGVGSEIGLGRFRLLLSGAEPLTQSTAGCLLARGVQQHVGDGRCVLHPTDLRLLPGEFVALVGEAGSGKSTLLKILAGATRPSAGSVSLDSEDIALRLSDLGYVPQADILHFGLTAREALRYGAGLRLPADTRPAEIDAAVNQVLLDLELQQHGDTKIGAGLSGGQQRRVGIGMELLGSPRMLFLDEPGASLDVRLERQLMEVLRRVTQRGCGVVAITHRTNFLGEFDRLLVMGRGGVLRFDGAPEAALRRFGITNFEAIYDRLAERESDAMNRPALLTPLRPRAATPARRQLGRTAFIHQLRVLSSRSMRVLSRDPRNLAFLLLQAPVLAALAAVLFGGGAFAPRRGNASNAAQLLFVLAIVAAWVGAIGGVRALIRERAIFLRERALGVQAGPYLMSKLLVLGGLGLLQSVLLSGVAFAVAPLHASTGTALIVAGLLALGTEVALATGLLLSAMVATEEQASSLLPLLLVPQVLCAGAIVAIRNMGPLEPFSVLISSRWVLAGAGSALKLTTGPSTSRGFALYYGDFFDAPWYSSAVILFVSLVAIVAIARWRLQTAWRQ
jgi:ABC-type multidrug transport system ATPase subunit/pSer/pThr/pTyr-binding forkhead associated (FHA) protein